MEIKTTYTVAGTTFETEQEAIDHSYYLDRKDKVADLLKDVFPISRNLGGSEYRPETIFEKIVENPQLFRQVMDVVEGK